MNSHVPDDRGLVATRLLDDSKEAAVAPLLGGRGRLTIGPAFENFYDEGY